LGLLTSPKTVAANGKALEEYTEVVELARIKLYEAQKDFQARQSEVNAIELEVRGTKGKLDLAEEIKKYTT
jgi:hypothetical protein